MNIDYILALDLGGTKLAAALMHPDGELLTSKTMALEGRQGKQVGQLIVQMLDEFVGQAKRSGDRIGAMGIAVPGIYNQKDGTVWAPNIPGWDYYPLLEEISAFLGSSPTRVRIDSDRACYILGEYWKGEAAGCSHAIYLAVGTGIGAGILVDGRVLRGSQDIAGAIGWMALRKDFQTPYTQYGCFEYHASGQGIGLNALPDFRNASEVFSAYDRGDSKAVALIDNAILCWGQAAANLVSLFNPDMIVFGGGVFGPAAKFIDRIYEEACRWAQPVSIRQVRFVSTALGDQVALYGAAYLAMEN
jgi:glucokinase